MQRVLAAITMLCLSSASAGAVDRTFETALENSLKGSVPANWFLRASWRDDTLVVFVSPPVPQSFDLWYQAGEQKTILGELCKAVPKNIWEQIGNQKDIAMEQVVGGNGGKGSWRLSCKEYLADRNRPQTN